MKQTPDNDILSYEERWYCVMGEFWNEIEWDGAKLGRRVYACIEI